MEFFVEEILENCMAPVLVFSASYISHTMLWTQDKLYVRQIIMNLKANITCLSKKLGSVLGIFKGYKKRGEDHFFHLSECEALKIVLIETLF